MTCADTKVYEKRHNIDCVLNHTIKENVDAKRFIKRMQILLNES